MLHEALYEDIGRQSFLPFARPALSESILKTILVFSVRSTEFRERQAIFLYYQGQRSGDHFVKPGINSAQAKLDSDFEASSGAKFFQHQTVWNFYIQSGPPKSAYHSRDYAYR